MSGATIRFASLEDAGEIARIYNHYVEVGGATFATALVTTSEIEEMMAANSDIDGWFAAEAKDSKSLLGWASARSFSDRFGYRLSCETAIYLMPEAMGLDIADGLQDLVHQHCIDKGIHHAMAKIIASNERSIRFHYRRGFTLVGIQDEIGHLNGEWQDVAILQRLFPAKNDDA